MENTKPLAVIELGNPTLRRVAQVIPLTSDSPLLSLPDTQIQTLIDQLLLTVEQSNGVGIAAPQVGESIRLFIVASRPNPRYPNAPEMSPTAMINPRIIAHSPETDKSWEGCLSVPGIRGLVPRYTTIQVEYTGRDGNLYQRTLTDFVARIFQHELDHLDGIVFLDRVETTQDLMSEREYQTQIVGDDSSKK
ncbi:peptide deformylase [Phormidium sp. CLA17]|uniref:peptide deformylase n=1 Tax=Leptolyngbya sp. Cla-17 TaxID=2803751 RepID=UPI0014929E89|nr:peptide deformylase [Leptolyngbya sp. Cla-17]MBM0741076.1 peptide deformylase [Leptolyngbya sp. Cla-17]